MCRFFFLYPIESLVFLFYIKNSKTACFARERSYNFFNYNDNYYNDNYYNNNIELNDNYNNSYSYELYFTDLQL